MRGPRVAAEAKIAQPAGRAFGQNAVRGLRGRNHVTTRATAARAAAEPSPSPEPRALSFLILQVPDFTRLMLPAPEGCSNAIRLRAATSVLHWMGIYQQLVTARFATPHAINLKAGKALLSSNTVWIYGTFIGLQLGFRYTSLMSGI